MFGWFKRSKEDKLIAKVLEENVPYRPTIETPIKELEEEAAFCEVAGIYYQWESVGFKRSVWEGMLCPLIEDPDVTLKAYWLGYRGKFTTQAQLRHLRLIGRF